MINEDIKDFKYLSAKLRIEQDFLNSVSNFTSLVNRTVESLDDDSEFETAPSDFRDLSSEQKNELKKHVKDLLKDYVNTVQDLANKLGDASDSSNEENKEAPEEKKVEVVATRVIPPNPFQPQPFGY